MSRETDFWKLVRVENKADPGMPKEWKKQCPYCGSGEVRGPMCSFGLPYPDNIYACDACLSQWQIVRNEPADGKAPDREPDPTPTTSYVDYAAKD